MSSTPLVSVLMCTYNDVRWLPDSIDSVLAQSLADLELLIVDDGSTDATPELLAAAARKDPRVRLERVEHGRPARALNHGLGLARGEFVARIDADDWAHPERLATQVAHLRAHPDVGIVGSAIEKMDENGKVAGSTARPIEEATIRFKALLWCPFTSSSVTLRRGMIEQAGLRYDERLRGSEDYDFFARVLDQSRAACLEQLLARYRVRDDGFSRRNREEFENIAVGIACGVIERTLPGFPLERDEVARLRAAFHGMGKARPPAGRSGVALAHRYLELLDAYCNTALPPEEVARLRRAEARRFLDTIAHGHLALLPRVARLDPGLMAEALLAWLRLRLRAPEAEH